nr:hypothetical protein [Tanacetum cinerariifolium]
MAGGEPSGSNIDFVNGLDGGNPLHMNLNDSTSTFLILFKLTGPENYRMWTSAMKLALQARNKCNVVVLTWIINSVSVDVYMGLVYSVDAVTGWIDLESTYDIDGSIIFNLLHKISCLKQGGSSLADYYHRLNSLWREFDALIKLPTYVCDANKELETYNKLMKLMQFLMGVDECYLSVRRNLLTRDPLPESSCASDQMTRSQKQRWQRQGSRTISLLHSSGQSSDEYAYSVGSNEYAYSVGSNEYANSVRSDGYAYSM